MGDDPEGLSAIAASFSALMRLIDDGPNGRRLPDEHAMLLDRVRDALDRRVAKLDAEVSFVANTFTVEAVAFTGARSEIWRLRHRDLSTLYAIKTLPEPLRDDVVARDLLLREGRIGILFKHPNVMSAQTVLRLADGRPALLMEWMDGSLETLCRTQNLRARNVTSVISAVLAALGYVHESGFAHGDIAPANMLYSTDMPDTWKLADFGIALEHRRRYGELEIRRAGSPDFTAPEQRSGNEATPAGDIYSVGRLLGFAMGHCPGEPAFAERMSRVADLFCRSNPNERPAGARSAAAAFSDAIGPS